MSGDPFWNETVLLMHMDGAPITDVKGHAVAVTGTVARSPAASVFGGYSAYFDGVGDKLTLPASIDWNLGSTYTIEFWAYPLALPGAGNECRILMIGANGSASGLAIAFSANGGGYLSIPLGGQTGITLPAGTFTTDAFHHYSANVRAGVGYVFKDGALIAGPAAGVTAQTASSTNALVLGYDTVGTVDYNFYGYLDEVRITKGTARNISGFSVPSAPYPNLITKLSGTTKDASGALASRLVRAYRQDTGAMSAQVVSDVGTGAFTLDAGGAVPYYITEHDTTSLTASGGTVANAAILDNLIPI